MAKYKFLTPEWVGEAKRIRAAHEDEAPTPAHIVRMNMVITDVDPAVSTDDLLTFMDTSQGKVEMDLGQLENPDLTVTVDYATARQIIVDGNPQAGMQAFMAGKVKVVGDMTKMMALQTASTDPVAATVAEEIKAVTEE